jgi:hypothetical protein
MLSSLCSSASFRGNVLVQAVSNIILNPQSALNPLSWTINRPLSSQSLEVSPSAGITFTALTNTTTMVVINGLVSGTEYTFTITFNDGNGTQTAQFISVWTSNNTHFYTFNTEDTNGTTLINQATSVRDLTPLNANTVMSTAIKKNGTGSYTSGTNYCTITPFTLDVTNGYTISMWMYYQTNAERMFNIRFANSTSHSLAWCLSANGRPYAYFSDAGSGSSGAFVCTSAFPVNQWTHFILSCSRTGTGTAARMTTYVNGVFNQTTTGYQLSDNAPSQSSRAQIGGYSFAHRTNTYFTDDFRIYNKPITNQTEATFLYNIV